MQVEPAAVAGSVGSVAAGQVDQDHAGQCAALAVGSGELALAGHVTLVGLEAQLANSVNESNDVEELVAAAGGAEVHHSGQRTVNDPFPVLEAAVVTERLMAVLESVLVG